MIFRRSIALIALSLALSCSSVRYSRFTAGGGLSNHDAAKLRAVMPDGTSRSSLRQLPVETKRSPADLLRRGYIPLGWMHMQHRPGDPPKRGTRRALLEKARTHGGELVHFAYYEQRGLTGAEFRKRTPYYKHLGGVDGKAEVGHTITTSRGSIDVIKTMASVWAYRPNKGLAERWFLDGCGHYLNLDRAAVLRNRDAFRQGFIDREGRMVIQARYEAVGRFSEGLARFKTGGLWGYMNREGKAVIAPRFKDAGEFSEGRAAVRPDRRFGYIDKTGKMVIPPRYQQASEFRQGIAWAVINPYRPASEYIDRQGRRVIDREIKWARPFHGGVATARMEGGQFMIDPEGKTLAGPFLDVDWVHGGYAAANVGGTKYVFDSSGRRLFSVPWKSRPFSEGLALVRNDGPGSLCGFIDKNGKTVIEPQFEYAGSFSEGLAVFEKDGRYGYIDRSGGVVIPPRFFRAYPFSEGLACVMVGDRYGFIDRKGTLVIDATLSGPSMFHEGRAAAGE